MAAKQTETQTCTLRMKNEINFLYKKKFQLNKQLYTLHINNANTWGNIDNNLDNIMKIKYTNINNKLNKLKEDNKVYAQQNEHVFHQQVDNLSNVMFTNEEMTLLNKGLKYNLHHKYKRWIQTLALEADTVINLLDPHKQAYMKQVVTQKLRRLINNNKTQIDKRNTYTSRQELTESKLVKKLHEKIEQNNLIITKADKGRMLIIIIPKDVYNQKINDFVTQNKFTKVPNNYTKKQQKAIKTAINAFKTKDKQINGNTHT
jgi:hypothetical protein